MSRALLNAVDSFWEDLQSKMNVHKDSHGTWVSKVWKKIRAVCRRCAREAKQRRQLLEGVRGDVMDVEGHEREAPVGEMQTMEGECMAEQEAPEGDVMSTMQSSSSRTPPWRRNHEPRDKWLKPDDSPRRRRPEGREWRKSRSPSRSRHPKGKGKARKEVKSSSWKRYDAWGCSAGSSDARRTTRERVPVVEVPDEHEEDTFTTEDAIQLWRNLLELSPEDEEEGQMGLPDYMRDNLRETAADMSAGAVHTMLAALIQLQALISAQATEVLNARLQVLAQARGRGRDRREDEVDETNLMQQSSMIATAEDGPMTFGWWLQKLSDALSEMGPEKASTCSHMLKCHLRTRYGDSTGRGLMGERALSFEALIVAYMQGTCEAVGEPEEGDKAWVNHWWHKLLPAIRQEELVIAHHRMTGPLPAP